MGPEGNFLTLGKKVTVPVKGIPIQTALYYTFFGVYKDKL